MSQAIIRSLLFDISCEKLILIIVVSILVRFTAKLFSANTACPNTTIFKTTRRDGINARIRPGQKRSYSCVVCGVWLAKWYFPDPRQSTATILSGTTTNVKAPNIAASIVHIHLMR